MLFFAITSVGLIADPLDSRKCRFNLYLAVIAHSPPRL